MTDEEHRLFTLANTAALVLFTENGNPPRITLSQKTLAEHGVSLLAAYKKTMVFPAMEALGKDLAASLASKGFAIVPIKPTFGMMDAFSGTRWASLPDAKQKAELDAYAAMLSAAAAELRKL